MFTPHPSGTKASDPYCWSSGPWLPDRFYCPASSSLIMATSAPLLAACRLMDYSVRLRAPARQPQRVPNVTLSVLLTMPLPVLRWLQRLHLTMPSPLVPPSPRNHGLGSHISPTNPDPMGSYYRSCNIRFMLRPGHLLALLRSGLLLPSLLGPGRPCHPSRLSLDGSSSFSIAGLSPAGLSALWAARLRLRLRKRGAEKLRYAPTSTPPRFKPSTSPRNRD